MKKRIGIVLFLTMTMVMSMGIPVLAWGDGEINVECSDINAPEQVRVGSDITASGTVTITSEAEASGFFSIAYAESNAGYSVTNPNAVVVADNSNSVSDFDGGIFHADADASQTYEWSTTFNVNRLGDWEVSHYGDASVIWGSVFPPSLGSIEGFDMNSCVVEVLPMPKHEKHFISIVLPDARITVERYGTMRYVDVDFNDGTWRIQIDAGVQIWDDESGAARLLVVDETGIITSNVWYNRGEPVVSRM